MGAALVQQEVEHALSDLWCERLVEVIRLRQGAQQAFSTLAVWMETLCDVNVEGDDALLVLQAQALHTANDIRSCVVLHAVAAKELILVCRPQGVHATIV